MFLAHSFRLRDPWQCEPAEEGGLRWTRVFHRPSGLEPDDQLLLVFSGLPLSVVVTVNGHPFPPASSSPQRVACGDLQPPASSFDVTAILSESNRIELLIPPAACGLASPPSSLQPPASSPPFPYDARLAIIGRS